MMFRKLGIAFLVAAFFMLDFAFAEESPVQKEEKSGSVTLKTVVVKAVKPEEEGPFLPDVQGTKINLGKKTSFIDPEAVHESTNSNYRHALAKIPGLLLSEETTPLFSVGYRGLEPHRGQFMQIMKDGIPIHADMFGYPEAYYVPPLESVDHIEFIRGGAALMYGPQPGGALNYVTHMPVTDRVLTTHADNAFGTDGYFSTYESASGTVGPMGYYTYIHERQGDGFRDGNSDFQVISGGTKITINQTGDTRFIMTYDEYHEEHGEPGGLTRSAAVMPNYETRREFTTRPNDRFRLERYYGTATLEKDFSEATRADLKVYGGHYRRYSKRQRGGGFGTLPAGAAAATNDIEEQDFYNLGFEPRIRHDYELLGQTHTVSAGTHTFFSSSPRVDQRGATPFADSGAVRKIADRDTWYLSAFLENLFRFGKLSVTPGVRLEHIWQHIEEDLNLDKTGVPLSDEDEFDFAPLFGGGVVYEIAKAIEIYANISQSYRPKIFTQAVPNGTNQIVNSDLSEGKGVQYDFGLRGKPFDFVSWDVSYFILQFQDQIGTIGNSVQNVGDATHHGVEFFTEVDLVEAYDHFEETHYAERYGSVAPFFTLTLLDAEFTDGPADGRQPQYAPQYNLRFGGTYKWQDRVKVGVTSTFVDEHFADDANTVGASSRFIPSYKVWDLTGKIVILKNLYEMVNLALYGGINNVFDENYYARIRGDGIDPAYPRNFFAGVKVDLGAPSSFGLFGKRPMTEGEATGANYSVA